MYTHSTQCVRVAGKVHLANFPRVCQKMNALPRKSRGLNTNRAKATICAQKSVNTPAHKFTTHAHTRTHTHSFDMVR